MGVSRPQLCAIEDTFAQLGKERGTGPGQGDTYTRQGLREARRGDRHAEKIKAFKSQMVDREAEKKVVLRTI
jgi:hypothetical protein